MAYIEQENEIAWYTSAERAENALFNMFAAGDVCEGERPRIRQTGKLWIITVTERFQFIDGNLIYV